MVEGLAEHLRRALAQFAQFAGFVEAVRKPAAVLKSEASVVMASVTGVGEKCVPSPVWPAGELPGHIGKSEHPIMHGVHPCQTCRTEIKKLGPPFAQRNPFGISTHFSIPEYPLAATKQQLSAAIGRVQRTGFGCERSGIGACAV